MATREENLKKIYDELEKLDDEQLDEVAGGLRGPSYGGFYKAIKNLEQLIKGGDKVY